MALYRGKGEGKEGGGAVFYSGEVQTDADPSSSLVFFGGGRLVFVPGRFLRIPPNYVGGAVRTQRSKPKMGYHHAGFFRFFSRGRTVHWYYTVGL